MTERARTTETTNATPEVLLELARTRQPRRFALCERRTGAHGGAEHGVYAWGLDFNERRDGESTGAVLVGEGGWFGNADSAEDALEVFSLIRELYLVWV
ncbi:hypothetical protein [Actinopolyspora halophila]|uniref:hypothetical protein n=1 Tax=Actinopolyspora halophila TaxID=1850 RepID=UPI000377E096|nr:hypothetical protein [Actinopolyspora halophila]